MTQYFYIVDIFVGQFEKWFSNFIEMAKLRFERRDAEEKMLELVHFWSEDISKPEEDVEEFHWVNHGSVLPSSLPIT